MILFPFTFVHLVAVLLQIIRTACIWSSWCASGDKERFALNPGRITVPPICLW